MRSRDAANDVERALNVGDPIAHRFVQRIFERLRSRRYGDDGRAEQLHPEDVLRLALDVLGAHVHDAFHTEPRRDGRRGDAVLSGARLRDDPLLAEPARKQRLADAVVDLVRACVIQVLAF